MGKGSGGGQNTVTNNSAPPPEVMEQYRKLIAQGNQVAGQPLQQYTGPMVAGFNDDQNQAFQSIRDAHGLASPYFGRAQEMIDSSQTPIWNGVQQWSPEAIQKYMNPYQQDVVNATMANINETNAQQNQQVVGDAISKGAWGGDRAGVAQAELARQQALASNQTLAGLNANNYGQATQQFNQQQGAQLGANTTNNWLASQGSQAEAGLGAQAFGQALQGAGAQLATGQQQQQQRQAELNVPYEQFLQRQAYPYQNLSWLSSLSTGLGGGMGGTSTSTQPGPSTGSQVLGGLTAGAGILGATGAFGSAGWLTPLIFGSDRRIKEDIERVGKHGPYPVYDFKYKGDDTEYRGVMAQDVEKINPDAVGENERGIKYVDYSKLARGGVARGFVPHYAGGGMIPNVGMSFIPQDMQMGSRGVGIPAMPQLQKPSESSDAVDLMALVSKFTNKKPAEGAKPTEDLESRASTGFTMANADSNGLGDMVKGFQNPDGTTNLGGAFNAAGDSVPFGAANAVDPSFLSRLFSGSFNNGGSVRGFAPGGIIWPEDRRNVGTADVFEGADIGDNAESISPQLSASDPSLVDTNAFSPGIQPSGLFPQTVSSDGDRSAPQGFAPTPQYGEMSSKSYVPSDPINKPDPWLALTHAGLATMAGQSPFAAVNIGQGALSGIEDYQKQKERAAKESYQQGSLKQQAEKLFDDANEWRNKLFEQSEHNRASESLQQQQLDEMARRHAEEMELKRKQLELGRIQFNPITGVPTYVAGEHIGESVLGGSALNPEALEYSRNIGVPVLAPTSKKDASNSANMIQDSGGKNISQINSSIESIQRIKELLPKIDQGMYAKALREGEQVLGKNSPERAAYNELQKLEGNAAINNEISQGVSSRYMGFNMVKLGQGLFANPEMDKNAQASILDKSLKYLQMEKNANEVLQPFAGSSVSTLNRVKTKYYDDSIKAGFPIPAADFLSGKVTEKPKEPDAQRTVVKTQTSPSTGKKRIFYSDGTTEIQ